MPELPEVEIVRRMLAKLRGGTILRVISRDARVLDARKDVVGSVIRDVGRRGKWLRIVLDDGRIFSHLGMSGDWTLRRPDDDALPFERVRMDVERRDGRIASARYTDPRRFGRFITAAQDIDAWRALGPDPLLDGIDEERVLAFMKGRKRAVKEVLLDQTLLAGVGNILAIEALFEAEIDPRVPAGTMDRASVAALARGLRSIIDRTLAYDEAMLRTNGDAAPPFRVYGHEAEPCPRCGKTLARIVQGGRGTTFCPSCQQRPTRSGARRGRDRARP